MSIACIFILQALATRHSLGSRNTSHYRIRSNFMNSSPVVLHNYLGKLEWVGRGYFIPWASEVRNTPNSWGTSNPRLHWGVLLCQPLDRFDVVVLENREMHTTAIFFAVIYSPGQN
jgi:hypothetical protein